MEYIDNKRRITLTDKETGEYLGTIPHGTKMYTPEQQKRNRNYYKRKEEEELRKKHMKLATKKYGGFTWFFYKLWQSCDLGISPSNLTRLIYLSTFINFQNKLEYNGKPMTRAKMIELLNISERESFNFSKELTEMGIIEYTGNEILISDNVFGRGKLSDFVNDYKVEERLYAIRLYRDTIQDLYNRATSRSHKSLSYLFQMIPYINRQYNILCFNPLENNLEKIKPMTLNDYCNEVGFDVTHIHRLSNYILQPSFCIGKDEDGEEIIETAARIVISVNENKERVYRLFINPNVMYAGNDWHKVKVLGKF